MSKSSKDKSILSSVMVWLLNSCFGNIVAALSTTAVIVLTVFRARSLTVGLSLSLSIQIRSVVDIALAQMREHSQTYLHSYPYEHKYRVMRRSVDVVKNVDKCLTFC